MEALDKAERLAQLGLNDEDRAEYRAQLADILDMVSVLEAVDGQGVVPMSHPLDIGARLRPDEVERAADPDRQACQAVAPDTEDGLYRVPRVIG